MFQFLRLNIELSKLGQPSIPHFLFVLKEPCSTYIGGEMRETSNNHIIFVIVLLLRGPALCTRRTKVRSNTKVYGICISFH